jgi:hypothetical protein
MCFVVGVLTLAALPYLADASAFRGHTPELAAAKRGASPELEKTLLAEIEEVLGSEHRRATEARLTRIEEALRPTFQALPKNGQGRLGHAGVRYAMHRLFVQRHGWYVQGLEPRGGAWDSSSPTVILEDGLPSYIQSLFEKRTGESGGNGFGLHEVAVLAATLENLAHKESLDRLAGTYRTLNRSAEDPVTKEESHELIDTYMAGYILGINLSTKSVNEVQNQISDLPQAYPEWHKTQKFVREVQTSVAPQRNEFTYENVATVVEEIGERYGRWQDSECRGLKDDLVAIEDAGTGRVRVSDFYRSALRDGKWQFSESTAFLRQLGALDETDPSNPSVIIPNYINSPSNCLASSKYYSVCCIDECEDIFDQIEEKIGASTATPGEISALVAALPSATVLANRMLSPLLLQRLEEVAAHHGGQIPLHGRLFAQWLHYAFPRECSYPHMQGTTAPMTAEEWIKQSGQRSSASKGEMAYHVNTSSKSSLQNEEELHRMWTMQEELIISHEPVTAQTQPSSLRSYVRAAVCIAVLCSAGTALWQTFHSAKRDGVLLPTHHSKCV